jgi:two-component system NtrC family sensor kinase
MNELNTRVLVIDDEEMVRDNIAEILMPNDDNEGQEEMTAALNVLFDSPKPLLATRVPGIPVFAVDKAANGEEGLRHVIEALEQNKPYAVIFLDMRMPGWSGLETAIEIRKRDEKAEIIFITAYSDRSIEEIVDQAGQNVGYHCKPYAPEEIIQLATKAVTDYNKLRNLESLIESISFIGLNRNQLAILLKNILHQLAGSLNTDMALIGKLHPDFRYEKVLSIGALEEKVDVLQLIDRVNGVEVAGDEIIQLDELIIARLDNYSIFALLKKQERLKTEKMYLLKLFVQNAAQAIRNAELQEELIQKEKLSAVGQVIGMVMHDLRTPVKNISLITQLIREDGFSIEMLDMIDQSADAASEIFDDFIDFIKNTKIKKQEILLDEIISSAVESLNINSTEKIAVSVQGLDNIKISGDRSKLKRSIANLLRNSADAMISMADQDKHIHIHAKMVSDSVIIEVRDSGPGIPEAIMSTLFNPFVTINKSGGTGLGLAIVKQFIEAHHGAISFRNDHGAVFTITLPLS